MTTVVTRLYETVEIAEGVAETLRAEGFPGHTLDVIAAADADTMEAARVERRTAERYAAAMGKDFALLVCRAPFTPFGAALRAQQVANAVPSIDAGVANEILYIREVADLTRHGTSVYGHHPLMMTRDDYVGSGWSGWRLSDVFGFTTVSRRNARPDNLSEGPKSTFFWPGKMLSTKARTSSVFSGGRHMSRGWWPMPLVRTGTKSSIMKDHPHISPRFGFPIRTARD
jgi:hypothetical protein